MKILSGGQTGVDRAALDAAIEKGIPCGGWCPKGGWAEDMPRPPGLLAAYPMLQETPLGDPVQRTEWNVRDSEMLLVLLDNRGLNSSGTERAILHAHALGRPVLVIDLDRSGDVDRAMAALRDKHGDLGQDQRIGQPGVPEDGPFHHHRCAALRVTAC